MKMLVYIGDLVTDIPGLFLGGMIARYLDAKVTLFHVAPKKNNKQQERKEGKELLEQAKEKFGEYPVKTRVRRGNIAKRILEEVQENQQDMVIITASRFGGYPSSRSVGRDILPKMPCCVLIAKNPKPAIKIILILTGGLKISEAMIKVGARLACSLAANVTLMHVAANVPSMYTGLDTIDETLDELLQTDTPVAKHLRRSARILDHLKIPSEIKLKHGDTVYEIIREIDREDYDLVILGASGVSSGFKGWFLGNVTKDIIDLVGIPVLVVNQKHAEKLDDSAI